MSGTLFRHHIRVRVRIAANKARFTSPNQQIGFSTTTTKLPAPTATLPSTNSSRPGNSGTVSNAGDTTQRRGYTVGVTAQRAGSSRNLSPGDNVAPRPITPAVRRIAGSIGASREESGVITEVNSAGRKSGGRAAPLSGHGTGVREYGSSAVQGLSNGTVQPVGSAAPARVDAVVIGAGQAGLSVAYHLQKAGGLRFVTLDANEEPGGAWRHRWPSLQLFSTRKWSSLPGYPMFANGACEDGYPSTREMAIYMEEYESIMKLNVVRPVTVTGVTRTTMGTYLVETDCLLGGAPARWECRAVISAAGTHRSPIWPRLPGAETFRGVQIHSSQYRNAEDFRGARVAVVGGGNSGAQILAEVSQPGLGTSTLWSLDAPPSFLPKDLPGKEIFDLVARLRQKQGYVRAEQIPSLHSIIMQPGVLEASERGAYDDYVPPLTRFTRHGIAWDAATMTDNEGVMTTLPAGEAEVDAVIWCTGYQSNTSHLARLGIVREDSTLAMNGADMGEAANQPGVFAVGYGNWAGVGSGSIPGVTMYAKRAASAAIQHLRGETAFSSASLYAARAASAMLSSGSPSSGWPGAGRAVASSWPGAGGVSEHQPQTIVAAGSPSVPEMVSAAA